MEKEKQEMARSERCRRAVGGNDKVLLYVHSLGERLVRLLASINATLPLVRTFISEDELEFSTDQKTKVLYVFDSVLIFDQISPPPQL